MAVTLEPISILLGLLPIGCKAMEARFDGALKSSEGGLLVLREIDRRLDMTGRLAACIRDARAPERVVLGLDVIICFRMLIIAAGYEDGIDADSLRADPMFKLAMDCLLDLPALLRMGRAMVDHYCASFHQVPCRIVPDIDGTFDAVHGSQQLRLFNAYYDEYGFQPIVVFDDEERMLAADRTSCCRATANQMRLFLHLGAYWVMWRLRAEMARRSTWRVA